MQKQFGEFECEHCKAEGKKVIFFEYTKYRQHIGGKHKKGTVASGNIIKCKKCGRRLIKGKNWSASLQKQGNLICNPCKRKQNRESYMRRIKKRSKGK